jgi:hypothetical protein
MLSKNLLSDPSSLQLTLEDAQRLCQARATYKYPKVYMEEASNGEVLVGTIRANFVAVQAHLATDDELDRHHFDLLHSTDPSRQLLGVASVIYWGFFTFSDNLARVRARKFLQATSADDAARFVDAVVSTYVASEDFGQVLACCEGVAQLGRTPFASKVLAFMFPEMAAVYDNKLDARLSELPWSHNAPFIGAVGTVKNSKVRWRYNSWLRFLTLAAAQLNRHIAQGADLCWRTEEGVTHTWRPLDVERAIFASLD